MQLDVPLTSVALEVEARQHLPDGLMQRQRVRVVDQRLEEQFEGGPLASSRVSRCLASASRARQSCGLSAMTAGKLREPSGAPSSAYPASRSNVRYARSGGFAISLFPDAERPAPSVFACVDVAQIQIRGTTPASRSIADWKRAIAPA